MNPSFVFLYGKFDQAVEGTGYSINSEFIRYDSTSRFYGVTLTAVYSFNI